MNTTAFPALHTRDGQIIALAGAVSALLLIGALGFQYIGGLQPCPLCIAQRIPHVFMVGAAIFTILRHDQPDRIMGLAVGIFFALTSVGAAGLHAGVELGLWASPISCGVPDLSDPAVQARLMTAAAPDCAVPAWTFLGHSMAAWNLFFSSILLGLWGGQFARALKA